MGRGKVEVIMVIFAFSAEKEDLTNFLLLKKPTHLI